MLLMYASKEIFENRGLSQIVSKIEVGYYIEILLYCGPQHVDLPENRNRDRFHQNLMFRS